MYTQTTARAESDRRPRVYTKKPYRVPRLEVYGYVRDVTLGITGAPGESGGGGIRYVGGGYGPPVDNLPWLPPETRR